MLDALKDIVKHTSGLGFIDTVKVIGSTATTKLETKDPDNSVIIYGEMYQPIKGVDTTLGLSRLGILKGYLGLHEGSTATLVTENRNGVVVPTEILFDNGNDFVSNYRFMSEAMVNEQIKVPPFKGATWDVVTEPSKSSITLLSDNYGILGATEKRFTVSTDAKGTLKFAIGEGTADRTVVPFAKNVTGTLKNNRSYPLTQVLSILKLTDSSKSASMSFNDNGLLMIQIDSGFGKYSYMIPGAK
jgi:hypothetical protein